MLSQEKIYYLKLDDNFKIIKSKDNKSVILSFLHVKDGLDFNVYYFNIENEKIDEYNEKGVKLDYKNDWLSWIVTTADGLRAVG